MYSPEVIQRKSSPSNFLVEVKTTVLAGMLIPIEKVSVAKRHLINPSCHEQMRRVEEAEGG
jgi:hypothetical protein